jgi:hypothetical protein
VSLELDEVMYVPKMKVKFLSILALEDMGYDIMFVDGRSHMSRVSGLG